jgi:hypothetical protein
VVLAVLAWLALRAGQVWLATRGDATGAADRLTRGTARVAVLWYGSAAALLLCLGPADGTAATPRGRLARWCWTLAWAAYAVHVVTAFHHYHHWSHADAVRHTAEVSGVGAGVYVSHLFGLLWIADVAYWWLAPRRHAARSVWVGRLLHGFMAFIVFNATVVYESGPIRGFGLGLFALLGLLWLRRWRTRPAEGGEVS